MKEQKDVRQRIEEGEFHRVQKSVRAIWMRTS